MFQEAVKKVIYNVSLGYSDQSGIEINNDAQNLSGRVNLGIRLHPKVHVDLSLVGSINKTWGYAANVSPLEYATETSRSVLAYNEMKMEADIFSGNQNQLCL